MRRGEEKVALSLRILAMIEEVRAISDPVLPWVAFDKREQMFKDIDGKYQALSSAGDLSGAEAMKWSRIIAMCLGLNKDQVRAIDEDFFQGQLIDARLTDNDETKDLLAYLQSFLSESLEDDPGGLLGDSGDECFGHHAQKLFQDLIASEDVRDDRGEIKEDLAGHASMLASELRSAARARIAQENDETERLLPTKIIREVRLKLHQIKLKIPELSNDKDFKSGKFQYEVNRLKRVVEDLYEVKEDHM